MSILKVCVCDQYRIAPSRLATGLGGSTTSSASLGIHGGT